MGSTESQVSFKRKANRDFPGGPGVKTLHQVGCRFILSQGTKFLYATWYGQKERKADRDLTPVEKKVM